MPCGREFNAEVILRDSSRLCARYRGDGPQWDQYIAGEILFDALARMLGFAALPCVTLSQVDSNGPWKDQNLAALKWKDKDVVGLAEWVEGLGQTFIPVFLVAAFRENRTLHWTDVKGLSLEEKAVLAQWSDLVVLDFLSGHDDRLNFFVWTVDIQDGEMRRDDAEVARQLSIKNLAQTPDGAIWTFDNEAAFLHAYTVIYTKDETRPPADARIERTHKYFLRTFCVFRSRMIEGLRDLAGRWSSPADVLLDEALISEPLLRQLSFLTENGSPLLARFRRYFPERLNYIMNHLDNCTEAMVA